MRASQSQDGGGSLSTSSRYTLASLRRHQSFDETYLKDAERVEPSTSWFLNVRHEQSMDNFVLNPRKLIFFLRFLSRERRDHLGHYAGTILPRRAIPGGLFSPGCV